jgi:exopolysaccharide biosynthesis polyprenyl glycosylphosphotransferase
MPDTTTGSPGGTTGPMTRALYQRRSNRRHWQIFERVASVILDAILIGVSFWLAYYFRFTVLAGNTFLTFLRSNFGGAENLPPHKCTSFNSYCYPFSNFLFLGGGVVAGLLLIFALRGLYSMRLTGNWFRQAWTIVSSTTLGVAFLISYYFVFQPPSNSRLLVPFVWAAAIVVLCLGRLIVSTVMGMLYRRGLGETRLLVVGSGRLGKLIMQHIAASPSLGFSIVGFLHDMKQEEEPGDFGRFKMLGALEDLGMVIRSMQIDEVIIALPSNLHEQSIRSVRLCERLGTSFKLVPDLYEYELSLSRIDMDAIEGIPLIGIKQVSINTLQLLVTRIVDIGLSVVGLILGLPFWICIALAIKVTSPGPAIYRQTRIGLDGRSFEVFKFRTMYKNAERKLNGLRGLNEAQGPLFKIKDDPRITPVGKFLRRTSFDEFPQLLNVIRGEMSLVGPRPPLPEEVEQYADWQKERLSIKPGMTGLWQVRGRSDISFDEGVLMDLYYIENWSLHLYFIILLRTIPAVLFSRGAY